MAILVQFGRKEKTVVDVARDVLNAPCVALGYEAALGFTALSSLHIEGTQLFYGGCPIDKSRVFFGSGLFI
jgi:hypothetical protein